ncbi:MAG: hypothetical protein ACRDP6_15890 [Actinoallomurus sp.]
MSSIVTPVSGCGEIRKQSWPGPAQRMAGDMPEGVMSKIEGFYWDGRFPTANFRDARLRGLAGLLTSDIQRDGAGALDALDLVEQARGGRSDIEEWLGNSTSAYFRPDTSSTAPVIRIVS